MWFLGAAGTMLGVCFIGYGFYSKATGAHAMGRWALGRGSILLVVGITGFLGITLAAGGASMTSFAFLVIAAAAVAALLVLMLAEESAHEGANMTEFITRPARGPSTPARPREDRFAARPVPGSNRPENTQEADMEGDEESVSELA